ncbi:succinate-semialdehyde dehydrogenase [Candidatus Heimdallarchaeota archaeon B3_Heim]|nr:MAG: succinate-semialdehyde dehydrogenase [Candidatus Heimdallarchaeota archaeon B3_Heim]
MTLKVINPFNNEVVSEYPEMTEIEVKDILESVQEEYLRWRKTSFEHRKKLMFNAAKVLRENKDRYAKIMALEMGKPIVDGRAEIEKCAWVCEYYAEEAENQLKSEIIETDASKSFISYQPLGIILAVMPWNFPFWQALRFIAPTLMAGNGGVLKHASNVPGSALAIEEVFHQAGFPKNIFRTLLVGSRKVNAIIENPIIKAVTLTGSGFAGRAVASKAGGMLKRSLLELGGSDPYVILEDANIEETVLTCVSSRMINSGQSCIAAKRFIVVESQLKKFEELYVYNMKNRKMGDPLRENVSVGPQARHDLRDELHEQVQNSIAKGAKVLLGAEIPDDKGAFYPPTVLSDVRKGMPAYDEELFGPVAAIIPVKDEAEAKRVANDTVFGLGAAVFTEDLKKGERIATQELEAGACFVNAYVRSDPRLPFGGIKESGYGRELSYYGIREFTNVKTIYIR